MNKTFSTKTFAKNSALIALCLSIFVGYISFLASFSPRGISWLPYHYERVLNAIENIQAGFPLLRIGLTSWNAFDHYVFTSELPLEGYITPITNYLLYLPLYILWPDSLSVYGPVVDKIIIFITSIAFSFYIASYSSSFRNINFVLIFTVLVTSPWISRAFLAPYSELFLFFHFGLFLVCTHFKREAPALIFFGLSMLYQYHWAFLVGVSIIVLRVLSHFTLSLKPICMPFKTRFSNNLLLVLSFFPSLIVLFQKYYIGQLPFTVNASNTSFLFRVGVDSVHNFYFGGFLSALQYLSSNRLTVCISNSLPKVLGNNFYSIALYNCILLHLSIALFAALSIYGYTYLIKRSKFLRSSAANIIFFSSLLFLLIFQQLWATHLSGYSYSFGFIYSIGILGMLDRITRHFPPIAMIRCLASIATLLILVPTSIHAFYLIGEFG